MEYRLSHRAQNLRRCMMDAFHLRDAKDMIFFNSGQPAADLYPRDLLCAVIDELLADDPQILAYPGSQGDEELREALAERQNRLDVGAGIRAEQIVVTNGGTGGADLLAQLFVDPGDAVLSETPTFPETLDCFAKAGARLAGVSMDADGPLPGELERLARELRPRFFYVIPNFQNPTGRCTSTERRRAVVKVARRYGFFIVEDDPYRELNFDAAPPPSYYSLAPDCTISMGSLSKTIAPGMRLGWLVLPDELVERAVMTLKATALCYPALLHRAAARVIKHPQFDAHIDELRRDLKRRCRLLTGLMSAQIPTKWLTWETPLGGMFLWCRLHGGVSAMDFAVRARDHWHVAFFPGVCFTPNYEGEDFSLRLTFARQTDAQMAEGVRRIAAALESFQQN